jgi:YcaO-like protein with predicted kinase domain
MIPLTTDGIFPGTRSGAVPKKYKLGTHRTVSPQETLSRLGLYSTAAGVTRIANVTGLDIVGIPVVMVTRPNARMLSVSQGKGTDLVAAKVSGLMEAIETYHAERIQAPLRLASYAELAESNNNVMDPTSLPRPKTSAFHPDLQILWIEGVDIMQEKCTWVPYEMVHTNFVLPPLGHGSFYASSNGLAGGNHIMEAMSHAICEVVERDALTLWRFRGQRGQSQLQINPETVHDPCCAEIMEKYRKAGLSLAIWEMTADVRIPSFLCRVGDLKASTFDVSFPAEGFGCHPHRAIALVRALTEAAQSRLTQIVGSRDDVLPESYRKLQQQDVSRFLNHGTAPCPWQSFSAGPDFDANTFDEEVEHEMQMLQEAGFHHAVVVSLPSLFSVPVVRVIIPRLENVLNEENDVQNYIPADPVRLSMAS